jgi:NTP pyrophosphatase (non-canonical NTP hydrolase)
LPAFLSEKFIERIIVKGSHVELEQYQSIPHISIISFARALRWHNGDLNSWSPSDWFTALAGEVGEVGNVIKKLNRVRDGMLTRGQASENELRGKLKMEIGDSYIYLDLLARRVGLNLEDCVRDTFNRISEREGFPERL